MIGLITAAVAALQLVSTPMDGVYRYDVGKKTDYKYCSRYLAAEYFIFPDEQLTLEEAQKLVDEMGMAEGQIRDYLGGINVICPKEEKYGKADVDRFKDVFNVTYTHCNLKMIGIGKGGDFVNKYLAPIADPFCAIVTVSKKQLKKAALKDIVSSAWTTSLSKTYKLSNYGHTSYMGDKFGQYPYEAEEMMVPENFGMKKIIVEQNLLTRKGDYLWFEYFNEAVEKAAPKSVPLVVLLHGNGNDPRTQADASGFVQLASRENFMVIELEWQGTDKIHEWMGLDGIELVVNTVLDKYPQLDPCRVYAEGLSAGGFCATALGVHKSYMFAAVGSHSGGMVSERLNEGVLFSAGINSKSLIGDALQKRGHVQTAFFHVGGTCDDAVAYPTAENYAINEAFASWKLYRLFNGADTIDVFDSQADEVFGQKMENRASCEIKGFTLESGDVVVGDVPVMRLVAIKNYGHWNFVPAAEMMWNYFRHFSKSEDTRELIFEQ